MSCVCHLGLEWKLFKYQFQNAKVGFCRLKIDLVIESLINVYFWLKYHFLDIIKKLRYF